MDTNILYCWKCGTALEGLPLPLGRRAECPACRAELHVCRMCRHHDPAKARQCREPMAEEIQDRKRANFCEWFQPRSGRPVAAGDRRTDEARAALDALFGGKEATPGSAGDSRQTPGRLFGD